MYTIFQSNKTGRILCDLKTAYFVEALGIQVKLDQIYSSDKRSIKPPNFAKLLYYPYS